MAVCAGPELGRLIDSQAKWSSVNALECPRKAYSQQPLLPMPLPIMSRLPVSFDKEAYDEAESEDSDLYQDKQSSYLHPQKNRRIPGTLAYESIDPNLTYTISRLPTLDSKDYDLWKALHSLRPTTTNPFPALSRLSRVPPSSHHHSSPTTDSTAQKCPFSTLTATSQEPTLALLRLLFNWSSLQLPEDQEARYYGVIFRSRRRPAPPSASASPSTPDQQQEHQQSHLQTSQTLYSSDKAAHEEAVSSGGLLMYFYFSPDPVSGENLATCIWTGREEARNASALEWHRGAVECARWAYEWFELGRYAVVKKRGEKGLGVEGWVD